MLIAAWLIEVSTNSTTASTREIQRWNTLFTRQTENSELAKTSCDRDGEPQTSYCTEICSRIPQDGQDYVERDVVNLVEVCTKTVFDHRICREIGQEFDAPSHP